MLLGDEYKQLGAHIAGGAGFVSNFILWTESGYFDNIATTKPLLHLWSLSIEEQFYILWPVLVWFAYRKHFNVLTIIVAIIIVSLLVSINGRHQFPIDRFYLPQSRFWELMLGAALAYALLYKKVEIDALTTRIGTLLVPVIYRDNVAPPIMTANNLLSVVGFLMIVGAAGLFSKTLAFPGFWAIIPTVGACALIAAGQDAFINRIFLAKKYVVLVGLISFPLYLWHWPIISFIHIIEMGTPNQSMRIFAVIISFLLAWFTYRCLERPLRFGTHDSKNAIILISLMILMGLAGTYCFMSNGLVSRLPVELRSNHNAPDAQFDWDYPTKAMRKVMADDMPTYYVGGEGKQTLFWGDSNTEQYAPRISKLLEGHTGSKRGAIFVTGGSPPINGVLRDGSAKAISTDTIMKLMEDPNIDRIVIAAAWTGYFVSNKFDYGVFTTDQYRVGGYTLEENAGNKIAFEHLTEMVKKLVTMHKKVYLVANIPAGKEFGAKINVQKRNILLTRSIDLAPSHTVSRDDVVTRLGPIYGQIKRIAEQEKAIFIDPVGYLCDEYTCRTDKHKDQGHLRASFTRDYLTYLDSTVTD